MNLAMTKQKEMENKKPGLLSKLQNYILKK